MTPIPYAPHYAFRLAAEREQAAEALLEFNREEIEKWRSHRRWSCDVMDAYLALLATKGL